MFLEGAVLFKPTNWKMYAAAKIRPAGMHIKYDLLTFLKFLLIKTAIAATANKPRKAIRMPGE